MKTDLLFALRTLRKAPGFFLLAIATLGLGIAANTTIFSLFYQVLLRSLPVHEPERLVVLHYDPPTLPGDGSSDNYETIFSYPMYQRLRATPALSGLAARSGFFAQMMIDGAAEVGRQEIVSGNFFEVLGLQARLGRLFSPSDDSVRGGNPVAVLAYDYWVKRFGASPAVLNKTILLNKLPFSIVGVAPEHFRGILAGNAPEIFVPISMHAALEPGWNGYDRPGTQWLTLIGRLAPGISRDRAEAELQPLFMSIVREHLAELKAIKETQERFAHKRLDLRPAAQGLNTLERQWRKPLFVLLSMVLLLLLIGCANVANLLMARAVNRSREISIRLALGASRLRVVRLLLTECVLLAVAGTLAGIALAPVLTRGIIRFMSSSAFGGWLSGQIDLPMLVFSAALMLAATLLFGMAPALSSTRTGGSPLGERTQTSSGGALHSRSRKLLLAGQIALSVTLLTTAGMFGRSLANLMHEHLGFRADHLLTFRIDAGLDGYDGTRGLNLYREVSRRIAALPGVESVGMAFAGPLSGSHSSSNVTVEGYTARGEDEMNCDNTAVGPGYFHTLGTPLLAGREFDDRDVAGAPKVAIVNQTFVKRYIAHGNPIGLHMERGSGGPIDITIVGVVADTIEQSLREPVNASFYVPFAQTIRAGSNIDRAQFFVRGGAGFENLSGAVRGVVASLDRTLPVYALHPIEVNVQEAMYTDRLVAALSTAFSALALLLTAVGLYGVIAYLVGRRTAEIGIRMVLGAAPGTILSMILGEVGLLIVAGGGVGLLGAIAAGRAIQSQLYGMNGLDPLVLAGAIAVLAVVAMSAAGLPALRAARVQPLEALRHE